MRDRAESRFSLKKFFFAAEQLRINLILRATTRNKKKKPSPIILRLIVAWCDTVRNIIATAASRQREPEAPRLEWKTADDWNHASRNPAYFPRAKHSSVTVDPLAAGTLSGKLTSIFGSYSPITPAENTHRQEKKKTSCSVPSIIHGAQAIQLATQAKQYRACNEQRRD